MTLMVTLFVAVDRNKQDSTFGSADDDSALLVDETGKGFTGTRNSLQSLLGIFRPENVGPYLGCKVSTFV